MGLDSGVLVVNVIEDGAAEKAGIVPTRRGGRGQVILGDIITEVDGKSIKDSNGLFRILDNKKVGDKLKVTVIREEEETEVEITLQEMAN